VKILVTNDDGVDSPLLETLIRCLQGRGDIHIVVPSHEQSWKSKSLTRFSQLKYNKLTRYSETIHTISGTPCDCVNIALYNLLEIKPDLVISGVNCGHNAGIGFIFSSGTIGACFEANIGGVPGIAISQRLSPDIWSFWSKDKTLPQWYINEFNISFPKIFDKIFEYTTTNYQQIVPAKTLSFNIPALLKEGNVIRARPGHTFYNRLFQRIETGDFDKQDAPYERDKAPDSDFSIIESGNISVSVLDITSIG
jgi:5'-nucleotidase